MKYRPKNLKFKKGFSNKKLLPPIHSSKQVKTLQKPPTTNVTNATPQLKPKSKEKSKFSQESYFSFPQPYYHRKDHKEFLDEREVKEKSKEENNGGQKALPPLKIIPSLNSWDTSVKHKIMKKI